MPSVEAGHSKEPNEASSQRLGVEEDGADRLPEDLQPGLASDPYEFPDVRRRAWGGALMLCAGVATLALAAIAGRPYFSAGTIVGGALCIVLGIYVLACSWPLRVGEREAILAAGRAVSFPMGPSSVSIGFKGIRSRPCWRLLVYSPELPRPKKRALVVIDAVDGTLLDVIEEDNPEEAWVEESGTFGGASKLASPASGGTDL